MHDAVVRLPLCLLADSRLDYFPEAGLVVRMNPLKEIFESGQTILWIETQNTVAFLRPVPDILVWTPCPTACFAQSLRFRQVCFTGPEGTFRPIALGNVDHGPHHFTRVAESVEHYVAYGPDVPDSCEGMNDTHLHFEIRLVADASVELLPHSGQIVRMDPLKNCFE